MKADLTSIIGKRFGRLLVQKFHGLKKVQQSDRLRIKYLFECLCDCGTTTIVNKTNLSHKNGGTLSCGCLQKEMSLLGHKKQKGKARPHMQKPDGLSVLHSLFLAYKSGAIKREIDFLITEDEFADLTSKNCHYCGAEPKITKSKKDSFASRKMNGIDRIDSNLGYIVKNCIPCCKVCNYMKQELTQEEFYLHIEKILDCRDSRVYL